MDKNSTKKNGTTIEKSGQIRHDSSEWRLPGTVKEDRKYCVKAVSAPIIPKETRPKKK